MRRFVALCFVLLAFAGCRDDFSLEAPFQDIPLIYAYLDASATDNFIRVERVFAETGGDATDVARIPDSLYYAEGAATVSITSGGETIDLERVDGEDFGFERESGVFTETPNILYRLNASDLDLVADRTATLRVTTNGGAAASAMTTLLPEVNILAPREDFGINPGNYARTTSIRWSTGDEAKIFDVRLYFNIREFSLSNPGESTDVRLEMIVNNAFRRPERAGNTMDIDIDNEVIWQFLANNLEANSDIVRALDNMDVVVSAAGSEVEELLDLAAANAGITSSQAIPVYTNVEGGLGILTSRSVASVLEFPLNPQSRDTLRDGIYTRDLAFQ